MMINIDDYVSDPGFKELLLAPTPSKMDEVLRLLCELEYVKNHSRPSHIVNDQREYRKIFAVKIEQIASDLKNSTILDLTSRSFFQDVDFLKEDPQVAALAESIKKETRSFLGVETPTRAEDIFREQQVADASLQCVLNTRNMYAETFTFTLPDFKYPMMIFAQHLHSLSTEAGKPGKYRSVGEQMDFATAQVKSASQVLRKALERAAAETAIITVNPQPLLYLGATSPRVLLEALMPQLVKPLSHPALVGGPRLLLKALSAATFQGYYSDFESQLVTVDDNKDLAEIIAGLWDPSPEGIFQGDLKRCVEAAKQLI